MQRFPWVAKVYIGGVVAGGVLAFLLARQLGVDGQQWRPLLVLLGLSAVAPYWKINLFHKPKGDVTCTMSLGFVPTFFTLLCFGPLAGMAAGTVGLLVSSLYPRRLYYYQVLFNIASVALSALAAGVVLRGAGLAMLHPPTAALPAEDYGTLLLQLPAIFLATLVYYLVNTVSVAVAMALSTQSDPVQTWRSHFLWTGPGYLAGASCATIVYAAGRNTGLFSEWNGTGLLLVTAVAAPILIVVYFTAKIYMDRLIAGERHIEELKKGKEELQQLYMSTVESLALAIDAKDRYTREHILRVQSLAVAIAERMGITGDALQGIYTGALLHDIGKLGIPEYILAKPGKLTAEEHETIRRHPAIGAMILEPVQFPWPVLGAVRSHHERWDGQGYPDGLRGEEIPLGGRILAVADAYDAMTTNRPYREGCSHAAALDRIRAESGFHFAPAVVEAFLAVMAGDPGRVRAPESQFTLVSSAGSRRDEVADGIHRASFEYNSLFEISQTVSVTLDLREALALVASKIHHIFRASACVIFLSDGDVLRAEMAVGANESFFTGAWTSHGQNVTGGVLARGDGFCGAYAPGDLHLSLSEYASWVPLHSVLVAPLCADGKPVGTINLYHERADAFSAEDLRVLLAVAAQAGRAIQNARVFEKTCESALTDALTGLHNARYMALFLDQELHRADAEKRPLSLLVMDLDNFKPINDTFGHTRGNEVLRDLGQLFEANLRSGDLVARYAGDEFVIVLPGTSAAEADVVARKIQTAVESYDPGTPGAACAPPLRVGVSIGAATFPHDGGDAAALIAQADHAMYQDKSARKHLAAELGAAASPDLLPASVA